MMKRILSTLVAAAFVAAMAMPLPASAGNVLLCQGDVSGASTGSRTFGGTGSPMPSGTLYTLNAQGCALVVGSDVGYFQSQGFTIGAPFGTVVATGIANNFSVVIPAGAYIRDVIFQELSGASVTGGMFVGSAATTSDVVSTAVTVGSKGLGFATDVGLAKRVFSSTASQTLFFGAFASNGSFNSAQVTATVVYGFF